MANEQNLKNFINQVVDPILDISDDVGESLKEQMLEILKNPNFESSSRSNMRRFSSVGYPPSIAAHRIYNILMHEMSEDESSFVTLNLFRSIGRDEELSWIALN